MHKIGNKYWEEGYNAYHEGVSLDGNPYAENTEACNLWEQGWEAADADTDEE